MSIRLAPLLWALLVITTVANAQQPSASPQTPQTPSAPPCLPEGEIQDNSFLIEEAYNQDPGMVQHINSFTRLRNGEWVYDFTQEWPVPGVKHQLSYTIPVARVAGDAGKTTGLGESVIEEKIAGSLKSLTDAGLELGYCARVGEVDVRFVAQGAEAGASVVAAENIVRERIGDYVFGVDDDQIEAIVVRLLTGRKQTVALAESCTGGFIANRLTNVPGASAVFLAGLVTYSNEAKQQFLGVLPATLADHGAVSEATAREMAEGARRRTGADFALSVTGIAGPDGGSDAKPVGTVFIGLATAQKTVVRRQLNRYDRETFKYLTSQQALDQLRRALLAG